MRTQSLLVFLTAVIVFTSGCQRTAARESSAAAANTMGRSIVYLHTASYGYEQNQPWKNKNISEGWACGAAVGTYEVIAPALSVANTTLIKARRQGQNEFINARIKVIDYESNLCLIELDPNTAGTPLKPLVFSEEYRKGTGVDFYWLSPNSDLHSGRGYLDRAKVEKTGASYQRRLDYIAANTSTPTADGEVYCVGDSPIGIACWSNDNKETGIIPAETINKFLAQAAAKNYKGFGTVGFTASELLDPALRSFLKIPASVQNGVYVDDIYTLGSGCDVLKKADVILSIDGHTLNPYGLYKHPKYEEITYSHLITGKAAGDKVLFEVWRDGTKQRLEAEVKNFKASQMLVPYQEFDYQPEYIISGGFVFQKLTREYLAQWGENWQGKVLPHLYHYYSDLSFKPTPERSDVVLLSFVLPTQFNLGYHDLRQLVVKKFNGMTIRSIRDIPAAQKLNPDSKYDVIEFELDNPTVVIDREQLPTADMLTSKIYGIPKLANIRQ
ncbi:MAG: hypothetical protein Q7T18_13030 [Sedimentisphaerales bacterium]|nr:hypothetical protein [Sedimentisphaerales bacterium]